MAEEEQLTEEEMEELLGDEEEEEEIVEEEKPLEITKFTCHGCGRTLETDKHPKEWCCSLCGAINVVNYVEEGGVTAASCVPPKGFEWKEPAGVLKGPRGKIYVSAQGTHMTKEEWMEAWGVDPEINLRWMRNMGKKGEEGYANMSTLAEGKEPGIRKVDTV